MLNPWKDGDDWAKAADFAWNDRWKNLDWDGSETLPSIFCKTDYLPEFCNLSLPEEFVLITHNSDWNITDERYAMKPAGAILWYAQNALVDKPDLIPIPIGLERPGIAGSGDRADFGRAETRPRDEKLYVNFSEGTNKNRAGMLEHFRSKDFSVVEARLPFVEYLSRLKGHRYVLSPPGNGSDCHRTWEAVCAGSIPVCEDNFHNRYFRDKCGVKMILYADWRKITAQWLGDCVWWTENLG